MIRNNQGHLQVSGEATIATSAALLAEGVAAMSVKDRTQEKVAVFDLAGVTMVDSSVLSVIFGWMRAAKKNDQSIRLLNIPQSLMSLAAVYAVTDLLPQ
jgi:phospholipid transport system transporter-binding protein